MRRLLDLIRGLADLVQNQNNYLQQQLTEAVCAGNIDIAKAMLDQGASLEVREERGLTPIPFR
jgi:hypothetical protein